MLSNTQPMFNNHLSLDNSLYSWDLTRKGGERSRYYLLGFREMAQDESIDRWERSRCLLLLLEDLSGCLLTRLWKRYRSCPIDNSGSNTPGIIVFVANNSSVCEPRFSENANFPAWVEKRLSWEPCCKRLANVMQSLYVFERQRYMEPTIMTKASSRGARGSRLCGNSGPWNLPASWPRIRSIICRCPWALTKSLAIAGDGIVLRSENFNVLATHRSWGRCYRSMPLIVA